MTSQELHDLLPPWLWNPFMDLVIWFIVVLLVGLIWLWTRSGRDRKHEADVVARNVEDFAGTVQEANGRIPRFLLIFYLIVGTSIIGYQLVTLFFGYEY